VGTTLGEFASRYAALSATTDPLDLLRAWNDTKLAFGGESSRLHWRRTSDVRDPEPRRAAARFRREVGTLVAREDEPVRKRLLEPKTREAIAARFGPRPLEIWERQSELFSPENVALDIELTDLTAEAQRLLGLPYPPRTDAEAYTKARRERERELSDLYEAVLLVRDRASRNVSRTPEQVVHAERDFSPDDVARFRKTVAQHVAPLIRDIRARQARALGQPVLKPWHRESLPWKVDRGLDTGRLVDWASRAFARLEPRLAARFDGLVRQGLVDAGTGAHRLGGGFCAPSFDTGEVRIFATFTGAAHDLLVLFHEAGHAFQFLESQKHELYDLVYLPTAATEIPSLGLETLALPATRLLLRPSEASALAKEHLAHLVLRIGHACAVDEFERAVHSGVLTANERGQAYARAFTTYLPGEDWTGSEEWLETLHLHDYLLFELPFYWLGYALAGTSALALHALAKKDRPDALARWALVCESGGTRPFRTLLRDAGLPDPFDENTLPSLMGMVRSELAL
jgi:oligoendopeptidase F